MPVPLLLIPSIVIYYIIFLNICKYKFTMSETLFAIVTTYILALCTCLIPSPNIEVLANFVVTACVTVFAYQKIKRLPLSCFYSLLTTVTCMVGGNTTTALFSNIFNMFTEETRSAPILYIATSVVSLVLSFAISRLVGRQIHKSLSQISNEQKNKLALYGVGLSVLVLLLSYVNVFLYKTVDDRAIIESVNTILIASFFLFTIILMGILSVSQQKQIEAEYEQKSQDELKNYIQQLENNYANMRGFQHDHINLLTSFYGYTEKGDMKALEKYIEKNIASTNKALKSMDTSIDSLKFILIPELKGLLSSKLAYAQMRGFDVRIDISEPINAIPVNSVDLCRIVGIIIDNAIEELGHHEPQHAVLKFGIIKNQHDILIICSNPYLTEPQAELVFNKDYSTKGKDRGFGLYNLNRICAEYDNLLVTTSTENNEFTIMIVIGQV